MYHRICGADVQSRDQNAAPLRTTSLTVPRGQITSRQVTCPPAATGRREAENTDPAPGITDMRRAEARPPVLGLLPATRRAVGDVQPALHLAVTVLLQEDDQPDKYKQQNGLPPEKPFNSHELSHRHRHRHLHVSLVFSRAKQHSCTPHDTYISEAYTGTCSTLQGKR